MVLLNIGSSSAFKFPNNNFIADNFTPASEVSATLLSTTDFFDV